MLMRPAEPRRKKNQIRKFRKRGRAEIIGVDLEDDHEK